MSACRRIMSHGKAANSQGFTRRLRRNHSLIAISALTVALVAACASSGSSRSSGSSKAGSTPTAATTIRFGFLKGAGTTLAPLAAQQEDIFDHYNLHIDFIPVGAGGASLAEFASHSIDLLINGPAYVAQARSKGIDLRAFCGFAPTGVATLIAPSDSSLPTLQSAGSWQAVFKALKGKDVGVPGLGGLQQYQVEGALKEAGMSKSDVHFVATGTSPATVTALLKKHGVAALIGFPFLSDQLLATGTGKLLMNLGSSDGPTAFQNNNIAWLAPKSFIDSHKAAAKAFCNAMKDAYAHILKPANSAEVKSILSSDIGLDSKTVSEIMTRGLASANYPLNATISQQSVDNTVNFLKSVGLMNASLTYADYVDLP